jgi:hypothetical protein
MPIAAAVSEAAERTTKAYAYKQQLPTISSWRFYARLMIGAAAVVCIKQHL